MKLFTVAAGLALVLVTTGSARAATRVWTGAAAPNTNWSNPSNWTGSAVPASGDDLVFPGTAEGQSNFNDLPATVVFNSLRFANGATGYVISSANELKLASGITVTNSTFSPIVVTPVRLVADQTFQTFDQILFLGSIVLDGHQLIFDTTHSIDVGGIHLFSTNLPSVISGVGTIRKRGSGLLSLQQANTYTGVTIIEEGTVQLVLPGTLGSSANGTVLSNGATLQVFGGQTMSGPLELGGRLAFASPAPAVWPGPITLTSADATFDLPASTGLRVAGVVSGSGGLVKTNAGPLILEADDSYSGETRVQAGTLLISNSHLAGAVTLSSNTIFSASGQIGPLSSTGAQLGAGGLTSPGLLQVNGALTLDAATHFKVDINGTTPGISYDQVCVSGTVDLGGAQLVLSTTGEPALGSTFVIIRKDSPGPVAGTFAGLPQFATFMRGAFVWQIDYFGIDGNDVVLRVISPAFPGVVWDGGGADTNWLTAQNWLSDVAPSPEADLIFSNEAAQRTNFNNFPSGTTFNSLRFTGPAPATAFTLNGNPVALTAGIVADGSSGLSTLNLDLALASGASLIADGTLFFNGTVSNSGGLNLSGAGTLVFGGPLRGTGGLTSSAGFVWLQTNNFYAGSTLVSTGTVRLDAERSLGDAANVVQVESGATVQLDAATNVGNPLVLRGALQALGTNTWSGTIMVQGTNAALSTWFGPLTIAGAISGDGELAVDAAFFGAEVILSATNPFTGLTRLTTGLLLVNALHAGGPLYIGTNAPFIPTMLSGTGTVGSVFAGGTVAPGLTTTAGILTVAGSLTLSNTAVLDIRVGGTNEGVDFDQLHVSGGVLLDSPTLQLSFGGFSPPLGSTFTIIRNDSSSPVSGAFAGLAESAFFTNGPVFGRITYRGGDGNDVVLSIGTNLPPGSPTNSCTPAPAGLVSWYPGEGSGGDALGINSPIQVLGFPQFVSAKVARGIKFDGSSGLVIADNASLDFGAGSSFALEAWVRIDGVFTNDSLLLDKRQPGGGLGYGLGVLGAGSGPEARRFYFFLQDSSNIIQAQTMPVTDGGFHHVAAVLDRLSGSAVIYLDGVLQQASQLGTLGSVGNAGRLFLGQQSLDVPGTTGVAYNGVIDELSVYTRALSAAEVQAIFNAGSAGKCLSVCAPAPSGMVAWWRGDGNANDSAGTNNGTFQNGATLAPGLVGQAFSFNGVADFLSVPDSPAWDFVTNDFTIELWVKLNIIKKAMFIHQQSGTDAGGFEFDLQPQAGGLFFARDPTHATLIRAWSPDPGTWYHLAVTRSQDTYRLYVDGQQLGAEEADPTPLADVTGPLRIGDFSAEASYALDGFIDEVTIYNRALAGGEVQAIFNAGSAGKCLSACAPPPSGLVSWWRAEANANDFAGTNHGALEGSGAYTNGIAGQGFLFNGAIGGVDLGNVPAFDFTPDSSFSIEAWFNTFGPSGGGNDGQAIVSLNYNCSPTLQSLVVANGSPAFGVVNFVVRDANNVTGFVGSPPVSTNAFHHVVGVREVIGTNKTLRLYLDGALAGANNDPTTDALAIDTPDWIGRRNTCGTDNVFNGIIDEVSVYNRALTSDEVAVLFNAGSAGKCTNSQNVSQTNVTVLLRDSNGAPIAAGLVTLGNRVAGRLGNVSDGTTNTLLFGETSPSPQGFTDTQGSFTFTNVPPSIGYRVTASKTGYAFQPVVSNLPPLIASQMVAFVGTSNILRTVSGRVTFTDGSPAANIPILVFAASADGSVRTIGISTLPDITDLDGRYSRTGLPAVASCFVSPRAPQLIVSPRSQIVSLLDGDVTADFVATPKTWHISGVISPAAGASLGADVPVLVVFGDPGAGTNAGNASTIVSAATRQGAYSSPPLTEGRSYLIQAMGPGLQFTPARRGVLPLVADIGGANFTFVPAPVNITGRVTNSSGFGLSAPHVIISGGISATQQVSVDGAYAFYNVPPGQTYILSASQTNFFFNPASALLPNLSLSRTQDFAGGPLLALLGRIAFVRNDDVVVMNADSSLLVTVPKVFADATPFERVALSPDGTKVAYAPASRFSFNRYPLIVEDVDGSNVRLLTGLDEVAVGSAWSPDGTQVATVIHASASRQAGIYLLSIDGSTAFRLPNSTGQERDPAWSPDGTKVAFDAYVNGGSNGILLSQIFVTGTNDASPPQSQVLGSQPAWSPDGTQIAFLSASRVMRVGSFPGVATTSHDAPGGGSAPAWSPDGAFLASSDLQTLPFQPAGVRVTSTNGTFETTLADGQFPSWSSAPGLATPPGGDVTVSNGIAAVTFSTVSTLGTTTIIPTPPPPVNTLPAGYVAIDGGPTLMNFDVTTTAEHSGLITLCFTLTNITNSVTFDSLRILHNESGLLVDRTLLPPDPQAPNFAAKSICARVDSLSPFALAQRVNPSLPLISGLVVDTDGNPVSEVAVSVSGGGGFPARTDTRGLFTIPNLTSGESYAVLPSDYHYDFTPPLALIENLAGTNLLAFIATPKIGPTLSITADGANPGQFTLSWQVSSISYTLEFTGSLTAPDWGPVTVQPFIKDGYHSVTIEAASAPLFFHLRQ